MLIINHTLALSPYLYFPNLKIQQVLKRCRTSSSRFAHLQPLSAGSNVFLTNIFLIQEAVGLWIHIVRNQHRQVVGIGPQFLSSKLHQAAPQSEVKGWVFLGEEGLLLPALRVPKFNVETYPKNLDDSQNFLHQNIPMKEIPYGGNKRFCSSKGMELHVVDTLNPYWHLGEFDLMCRKSLYQ